MPIHRYVRHDSWPLHNVWTGSCVAFATLLFRQLILHKWKDAYVPTFNHWIRDFLHFLKLEKVAYSLMVPLRYFIMCGILLSSILLLYKMLQKWSNCSTFKQQKATTICVHFIQFNLLSALPFFFLSLLSIFLFHCLFILFSPCLLCSYLILSYLST